MSGQQPFHGKTILLTGAFGGFGKKFIRYFLTGGAQLLLSDLRTRDVDELIRELGLDAVHRPQLLGVIEADLSEAGCGKKLYDACAAIAPVDMVVHNAGIGYGGYYEDIPWEKVDVQLRVMLQAPMEITHHFLPDFLKRGSGHFVFVSSVAGFVATPFGIPYTAAKFGLRAFAMALYGESAKRGVDVSIVYPFYTRTDIIQSKVYGNPPVKTMPAFFIEDPDTVIREVVQGISARKLHIFPGKFSRLLWNAGKFYPLIAPHMKAPE